MSTTQLARAERRRLQRQREDKRDLLIGVLSLLLMLVCFCIAGTMDYQAEQAYRQSWYEANGINE